MMHKNIAYRRHQKERVIQNRHDLMLRLDIDWPEDHQFFTESNRLSKRKPLGHCQNRHCGCCNHKGFVKKYLTKTRDMKLDETEITELELLNDPWFIDWIEYHNRYYYDGVWYPPMFEESDCDYSWGGDDNVHYTADGALVYVDPNWESQERLDWDDWYEYTLHPEY